MKISLTQARHRKRVHFCVNCSSSEGAQCDLLKPKCSPCLRNGLDCSYDPPERCSSVEEGERQIQNTTGNERVSIAANFTKGMSMPDSVGAPDKHSLHQVDCSLGLCLSNDSNLLISRPTFGYVRQLPLRYVPLIRQWSLSLTYDSYTHRNHLLHIMSHNPSLRCRQTREMFFAWLRLIGQICMNSVLYSLGRVVALYLVVTLNATNHLIYSLIKRHLL